MTKPTHTTTGARHDRKISRERMQQANRYEGQLHNAAAALYGELMDGKLDMPDSGTYDKETLRESARRILGAANDPMWGKR